MPSAVRLREDYSAKELRALARRSKDVNQSRRLLSLAAVRDGMDRGSAAKIGGMDRQTLRDWVHRFNGSGPEGLIDNWTEGPKPRLSAEQLAQFAQIVEAGPDREKDGVVRWRRIDLKRVIAERFGVDVSRALCREASAEAWLLPHQRAAASSGAGRADRRGVQKNFPRALKAHLEGLPETTPVEIWFQMLCSRGLCQTGKAPHLEPERLHVVECLPSDHLSRYRTELFLLGHRVSSAPRTTRLSFIVWKRATAQGCLLSSPACATGWILRMTRLRLSSAALRPGGMDFGCIDF